jgi:HAD superfamily hydrolase (TIGR01509 family)
MTPRIIVFDLGKVLVDFDYSIAGRRISAKSKSLADDVSRFISQSPLLLKYETGLITRQQFYDEICRATGYCGPIDEFAEFFADIFTPIGPMVQLQTDLRSRGFPTYIFSNTNELAIAHIRKNFAFFSNFDGYVLSYEHGAMKPDAALYEVVERLSGGRGAEILYLDDRAENVEAGAARGWNIILQESADKSIAATQELGLLRDA